MAHFFDTFGQVLLESHLIAIQGRETIKPKNNKPPNG